MPGRTELTEAVARNLFKLMAIKDEYEIARLWTDGSFQRQLAREFERWDALEVHLAPPCSPSGTPRATSPSVATAHGCCAPCACSRPEAPARNGVRPVRPHAERAWSAGCLPSTRSCSTSFARAYAPRITPRRSNSPGSPDQIRGFGHVKEASLERAKAKEAHLLAAWRNEWAQRRRCGMVEAGGDHTGGSRTGSPGPERSGFARVRPPRRSGTASRRLRCPRLRTSRVRPSLLRPPAGSGPSRCPD